MDQNTCSQMLKILQGIERRYDEAVKVGEFDSRLTPEGVQLGVTIFLSHDKAHYLKKVIAKAKRPKRTPPPFINPTNNPGSLPSERARERSNA
jgi:hypothetical protein